MRNETLKLQKKAETSRHRAQERWPDESKEQVRVRHPHATLAVVYSEAITVTENFVTQATRLGLKVMGLISKSTL